jgi:hypothetical protein
MTELVTDAFRPVGPREAIANGSAVPYYLGDRKLRISVAQGSTLPPGSHSLPVTDGALV